MTADIRVSVAAEYLASQSDPDESRYTFTYHVSIENRGSEAAQLISRHWVITDGDGGKKEVRGLGVIGQQPTIKPGENYHYSSFSVLETTVGTMEGAFQMQGADGGEFEAPIPPFLLAVPGAIN